MPRLFISHSSKDSVQALAFQRWLMANGWGEDEVFIDLHGIAAGEEWQKVLVRANIACDALLFLASPDSLASDECRREVRRAEDDGKDVIVAMLRGITIADERLKPYADRQIVDLSAEPKAERIEVQHQSRLHLIDFHRPGLDAIHTTLIDRGHAPDSFPWPPKDRPNARPYPGLEALGEDSAAIFFGREADVMTGLRELRRMRERGSPRMMVIQAASGAGKSSFLRAGLWPKLGRTSEFVPLAIVRPAKGIITGPQFGLGKGLEAWFARHRRTRSAGSMQAELMAEGVEAGAKKLAGLLAEAAALALEVRNLGAAPNGARRLSLLIAVDQGEELFAAEDKFESDRFLAMLGLLLAAPPAGLDPYVLITIRADSIDALLRRVPELGIDTPFSLPLPPLSPTAYRDVITRPAAVHARRVARRDGEPELVQALVNETRGADALPLLAFTLQRLFDAHAIDRKLTLAQFDAMGGIGGSIDRALAEAQAKAGLAGTLEHLRRLMVPGLATWETAANAAKRLVPQEAEIVGGDRSGLAPLANALVEARLLTRSAADDGKGPATLEVAHEALLRRKPISEWLEAQQDALKLRDDVRREVTDWKDSGSPVHDLPRRGVHLESALALARNADFAASMAPAKDYLAACKRLETAGQRRAGRVRAAIYALMLGVIGVSQYAIFKAEIDHAIWQFREERPYIAKVGEQVLAAKADTKKPGETFRECATVCPEMVALPAGSFRMGSPDNEAGRDNDEGPVRPVTIAKPFAVAKFEVTWDEWEACVGMRGCDGRPTGDATFGKGRKPVINVSWDQAKSYVVWLSRMTGKEYRLLTEAEWEYGARAGTQTAYSFGNDATEICKHANLADQSFRRRGYTGDIGNCDDKQAQTAPVGSYPANAFGLHDMHGNVFEWVQDCYINSYKNAPADGSAVPDKEGCSRVLRGGSWVNDPRDLRAAQRNNGSPVYRNSSLGFRVARTLIHTP